MGKNTRDLKKWMSICLLNVRNYSADFQSKERERERGALDGKNQSLQFTIPYSYKWL